MSRQAVSAVDGRELYVEPVEFSASREGRLLLAGTPNYVWTRDSGGTLAAVARDSIFGALVDDSGRARMIPSPIDPQLLSGIRAVARSDGTWSVVFAELRPGTRFPENETAARLWYGVLDGVTWSRLEQLPVPTEGELRSSSPSLLVQRGDTLAWAVKLDVSANRTNIAVFVRQNGKWAYEVVPTGTAAYIALERSDAHGFVLAVAQADRAAREASAIFLWARDPNWRVLRRVVPGTGESLHFPALALSSGGGILSWLAVVTDSSSQRWEALAMLGELEQTSTAVLRVAPAVTGHLVQVSTKDAMPVLIAEHVTTGEPVHELRFVAPARKSLKMIGGFPTPFKGPFAAAWLAPSYLFLAGPRLSEADGSVGTLLLRTRLECPSGVP